MSKIEEIKDKYLNDADLVGSKSRFGFFSIPPSATAGHNSFEDKKGKCILIKQFEIKMAELKLRRGIFFVVLQLQEFSKNLILNLNLPYTKETLMLTQENMKDS